MEIPKNIVEQIFINASKGEEHSAIKLLLDSLYQRSFKEIVALKKDKALRENDRKIHESISFLLPGICSDNKSSIDEFSKIISSSLTYLQKSFAESDIKALLVFLSIQCYSHISFEYYFNSIKCLTEQKKSVANEILKILKNANTETVVHKDAPYYEKQLKKRSIQGIKEKNLDLVYDLILAIERSGRGFHFNFLLENFISFLYYVDIDSYVSQLNSLNHPEGNVFYLQSLNSEQLCNIALHSKTSNFWTIFEIMRQIVDNDKKKEEIELNEKNAILECLRKLYENHSQIYDQAITFLNGSKTLNGALGKQIKEISDEKVTLVFEHLLPFDKYTFNINARTLLLQELHSVVSKEKYHLVLETVYKRWNNYFLKAIETEDYFQNDLTVSDFADYIIQYYVEVVEDSKLIDLIIQTLNKITWIDSEWFINESKQITKYHHYLTEIFLLSYSYKQKHLSDHQVSLLWSEFKNGSSCLKYSLKSNSEQFKTMDENFT